MIAQQGTSNINSDTNKWSHSSVKRKHRKMTKKTANNSEDVIAPLCWKKKLTTTVWLGLITRKNFK